MKAKKYVDCTGDGDMAFMAGARYEKGDDVGNLMPGTLCSLWCNIDTEMTCNTFQLVIWMLSISENQMHSYLHC